MKNQYPYMVILISFIVVIIFSIFTNVENMILGWLVGVIGGAWAVGVNNV